MSRKRAGPLAAVVVTALVLAAAGHGVPPASTALGAGEEIACVGDACQVLPPPPVDPTLTTVFHGAGNPPVHWVDHTKCKNGKVRRGGKCVRKRHRQHHRR